MKILNIAYYTVIRNLRDKKSISLTLLFPILLILILGNALSKAYAPDTFSAVSVSYYNEDAGELGTQFDQFLMSPDIRKVLTVTKVNSEAEGKKSVDDKKTNSFIHVPADYTANAHKNLKSQLQVYQNNSSIFNMAVVKNILDSFANGANTMTAIMKAGYKPTGYHAYQNFDEVPISSTGAAPRAIDYYAVTMLAMTLMYGALYASFGMAEDKNEKTIIRIKSAPLRAFENYIGRILGFITTLVLQAIILILFTKFAYQSNWGKDMTTVILISVLFSICTTALGMMAYALTNDSVKASGILNVLVVVFTFVSGGYAKLNADGTLFDKLSYLSPNKLFQTAMFNTVYGGSVDQTRLCLLALAGITVVMLVIATVFGRRELA